MTTEMRKKGKHKRIERVNATEHQNRNQNNFQVNIKQNLLCHWHLYTEPLRVALDT